jgi:hypothetical protein
MISCCVNGRGGFTLSPPFADAELENAAARTAIAVVSDVR